MCLVLLIMLLSAAAADLVQPPVATVLTGPGWVLGPAGRGYVVGGPQSGLSWADARGYCEQFRGGRLATFADADEWALAAAVLTPRGVWIDWAAGPSPNFDTWGDGSPMPAAVADARRLTAGKRRIIVEPGRCGVAAQEVGAAPHWGSPPCSQLRHALCRVEV